VLLWQPGTKRVEGLRVPRTRVRASVRIGASERIRSYTAAKNGWYYLEIKMQTPGPGSYTLSFAKSK
jgi:hypothetical protein